jgi:hypothetical protein
MKKWIGCLLILVLLLSLAGCGIKENLEKKAGEALAENVLESTGGGDVDINGDKITIKGESGEELTVGGTEWPKSELAKSVPEFQTGTITAVLDSADCVIVSLESVKEADAAAYFATVKKDFTREPFEVNAEGSTSFGAKNADGVSVALQYSGETLTITVTKSAQ